MLRVLERYKRLVNWWYYVPRFVSPFMITVAINFKFSGLFAVTFLILERYVFRLCCRFRSLWHHGFRLICGVVWYVSRVQLKCDGTRWCTGGVVKGKLAIGMGSQYPSHYLGTWCIQHYYRMCAHRRLPAVDWTDAPRWFKWTRPFRRKTKSDFYAWAITFQTQSSSLANDTFI